MPVRIKHIPTQKYLAVASDSARCDPARFDSAKSEDLYLTLQDLSSSSEAKDECSFVLVQSKKRERGLTKASYVKIKHTRTNGERNETRLLKISLTTHSASDGTDYDYKEKVDRLYGVSLVMDSSTVSHHLVLFKIVEVQQSIVGQFYEVLGVTGAIQEYVDKHWPILDESGAIQRPKGVEAILDESGGTQKPKKVEPLPQTLCDWFKNGIADQVHAEMLHMAKTVDVMMVLLEQVKNEDLDRFEELLKYVCTALNQYVTLGGRRSRCHLAKDDYINLLLEKVGCGVEADKVLSTLARDEIKVTQQIVNCLMKPRIWDKRSLEDIPTLDLLGTLCFSEGCPVWRLQEKILQKFIEKTMERNGSLEGRAAKDARIVERLEPQDSQNQSIIAAEIKLFSQICKGVNKNSITKIKEKRLDVDEALSLFENEKEGLALRSACLSFLVSALIDGIVEESGTTVDNLWHTCDWGKPNNPLNIGSVYHAIEHEDNNEDNNKGNFKKIQKKLEELGKSANKGDFSLVVEVLDALDPLVEYGFYWDGNSPWLPRTNIIDMLKRIIVSPQGDVQSSDTQVKCIRKAISILHYFSTQFSYQAFNRMLQDYRNNKLPISEYIKERKVSAFFESQNYELLQVSTDEGHFLRKLLDLLHVPDNERDSQLTIGVFKLLFALFHVEEMLFSHAESTYIYTNYSLKTAQMMKNLVIPKETTESKIIPRMLQGSIHRDQTEFNEVHKMLEELADCFIIDKDDAQPNTINQAIAYSSGLIDRLLEYVCFYCKERSAPNDDIRRGNQKNLVIKACLVLQRGARRNSKVQEKIFKRYTDLVDAQISQSAVAELLTEVFTDCEELCRQVSDAGVSTIFHIASDGCQQAELFTTLQAVTKVRKSDPLIFPRYQDVLTDLIPESLVATFCCSNEGGIRPEVMHSLKKSTKADDPALLKRLNMIDLFAVCAEGGKRHAEEIGQKLFTLEDILTILNDLEIPIERKKVFCSLLDEVHLISHCDSLSAIIELAGKNEFGRHIEVTAKLMVSSCEAIMKYTFCKHTKIKTALHHLAHRHLNLRSWTKICRRASLEETPAIVVIGDKRYECKPLDVLFYVMDGFLPMMEVFLRQYWDENMPTTEAKEVTRIVPYLKEFGKAIKELARLEGISLFSAPHSRLVKDILLLYLKNYRNTDDDEYWELIAMMCLALKTTLTDQTEVCKSDSYLLPSDLLKRCRDTCGGFSGLPFKDAVESSLTKSQEATHHVVMKMLNDIYLLSVYVDQGDKQAEVVRNQFFVLQHIPIILDVNDIPIERKKDFCSLLMKVYLKKSANLDELKDNSDSYRCFMHHIGEVANLMARTSRAIMSVAIGEQLKIKTALCHLANHHLNLRDWTEICKGISAKDTDVDDEFKPLNVLFYVMDGFLPMVKELLQKLDNFELNVPGLIKDLGHGIEKLAKLQEVHLFSEPHSRLINEILREYLQHFDGTEGAEYQELITRMYFTLQTNFVSGTKEFQKEMKLLLSKFNIKRDCRILSQKQMEPETLSKLLDECDLVGALAKGHCEFPEQVHEFLDPQVFNSRDLLRILSSDWIRIEEKKPFACLLLAKDGLILRDVLLKDECLRIFKDHLYFVGKLMQCTAIKVNESSHGEEFQWQLKTLLHHFGHGHLSFQSWTALRAGKSDTVIGPNSKESSIAGVLFYVLDGFILVVTACCQMLQTLNHGKKVKIVIPELEHFANGLFDLMTPETTAVTHFSVITYQCFEGLLRFFKPKQCKNEIIWKQKLRKMNISIPSLRDEEVKLNESFKEFCVRFRKKWSGGQPLHNPSFERLTEWFYETKDKKEILKRLCDLMKFLKVLHQRLQRRLTSCERNDLDSLLLITLKLLNRLKDIHVDKSEHKDYSLKEIQIDIVKSTEELGFVTFHLHHPQDEIAVQVMEFFSVLVCNGNIKSQEELCQYLKSKDTELFTRMEVVFVNASASIRERRMKDYIKEDEALKHIIVVLQLVSDICDGQRLEAQKLFREQESQFNSVNIVSEIAILLEEMTDLSGRGLVCLYDVAFKAIQALIELCAGNYANQKVAFNVQILRTVNSILRKEVSFSVPSQDEVGIGSRSPGEDLLRLKSKLLELLVVLLEETSDESFLHFQKISRDIPLPAVLLTMWELWEFRQTLLQESRVGQNFIQRCLMPEKSTEKMAEFETGMFDAFHIHRRVSNNWDNQGDEFETFEKMLKEDLEPQCVHCWGAKENESDGEQNPGKEQEDPLHAHKEMYKSIEKSSRRIEVIYHRESQKPLLTRVYFAFDCKDEMSEEEKDYVVEHIKRSSPEEKVTDLIKWMKAVLKIRNHEEAIFGHILLPWIYFFVKLHHIGLALLTLLLNFFVIVFFQIPFNEHAGSGSDSNLSVFVLSSNFFAVPSGLYPLPLILGYCHLILSVLMVLEYFTLKWPNLSFRIRFVQYYLWQHARNVQKFRFYFKWFDTFCKNTHRKLTRQNQAANGQAHSDHPLRDEEKGCASKLAMFTRSAYSFFLSWFNKPTDLECFGVEFFGFQTLYRILFLFFSFAGLVHSGYWYCGCLLYVFLKSTVLAQILTALYRSAFQLLLVFLLGLVVTFIYAVVSFVFFHVYFSNEEGLFCETLTQCFATVTRTGLLSTLGEAIPLESVEGSPSFQTYRWRVFTDLSFFIIITTIGLNIVVAVMVDRFSELREDRDKILENKQNFCFICNKERDEFEREFVSFKDHIKNDHNMWNYVYFYIYLNKKYEYDHNALEKCVYDQARNRSIEFFPLRRSLVLEQKEGVKKKKNKHEKSSGKKKKDEEEVVSKDEEEVVSKDSSGNDD